MRLLCARSAYEGYVGYQVLQELTPAQAPAEFLDGKHTVFGRVIEHGSDMLVLRKIENVPTGPNNRPQLAVGPSCSEIRKLTTL